MKKNVFILGATGFIGKAVTRFFLDKKRTSLVLASKKGGKLNGRTVHPLDLTKRNSLVRWLGDKKIDCIIYLSSLIPDPFNKAGSKVFLLNERMHQQVLKYWLLKKCHLIYASSCSVAPLADNYYSRSKLNGEYLFLKEYSDNGRPLTVLRINAPYGYQEQRKTVVNTFVENALSGEPLRLMGTGKREQDFIYVDDVAYAFWLALTKKKYGVYNIAGGRSVTMRQLAKLIVQTLHSSSEIVLDRQPDPQEGARVKIDIRRARKELGFRPRYDLKKGLQKMAGLYRYENAR